MRIPSDASQARVPWVERYWIADLEQHWDLPGGSLTRSPTAHVVSELNKAIWTREGGVVATMDAALARRIASVLDGGDAGSSAGLLPELRRGVDDRHLASNSYLEVSLYCCSVDPLLQKRDDKVEALPAGAKGVPHVGDRAEHAFVVWDGATPVSVASDLPRALLGGHRSYAIGAWTEPAYRGRGLGKAVVSSLVARIVSEGGVALWNCDVLNAASLRLARSVGFVDCLWVYAWGIGEDEMSFRRSITGESSAQIGDRLFISLSRRKEMGDR